jgi:simple sugar transport system permease protein
MSVAAVNVNPSERGLARILWPLALLCGTLALLGIVILAAGKDPLVAAREFLNGTVGSARGLGALAARGAILAFYALGIAAGFRGGLVNIGAEGQSRIGAAAAVTITVGMWGAFAAAHPLVGIPAVLLAGAVGGALWSLIAGVLRHTRGVPEVVSTLLLNFAAMPGVKFLVGTRSLLQGHTHFQKNELAGALQFPGWGGTEFHSGVFLLLPAIALMQFWIFRSASGLRLRAMGFNPVATRSCGANTTRLVFAAFAVSGALAGLAGAIGVMANGALEMVPAYPDYGYTAIAVALVAGSHPVLIAPAALLFATLEVGAGAMEETAGVPHWVVFVVNGLLILAILARTALSQRETERAHG